MKNTILLSAFALFAFSTNAQITLEHTFTPVSNASAILFTSSGTKIMANDTGTNTIKLYNTDYTLWKSIPMPIPAGNILYVVQHVSDKLFNGDNQVEAYVSWRTTSFPFAYHGAIINEAGSIIYDLGNSTTAWVSYIDGVHKLFVNIYNTYETKVYSLPGELACGHCGGTLGVPKSSVSSGAAAPMAMPNPATGQVSIQHNLPISANGILTVRGIDGKTYTSYPFTGNVPTITIDINTLPAGMYVYELNADGLPPAYGNFIK